ncbi:uncharacterized protein [Haliotis asinina]|uniref:uncharacterized protein n=1 Tax=Haliotis asinina TaxID=109174 RepID=UPI003531B7A6
MKALIAWMCLVLVPVINALGNPLPGSCRICQKRGICKPPDCVCCSDRMPFPRRKTPQMVYFTFDDAVASQIIPYYKKLFPPDRFNPNGCPIAMTLFVSDKDTIYSQVKDFYDHGMEIGVHSVTHDHLTPETFAQEAQGQKDKLVAAGIPEKAITGWRSPFLEVEGNTQFKNLTYLGFKYDATLSTAQTDGRGRSFPIPFTLDYGWPFSCRINDCPTEPHKGFWEVPVVELRMTHDRPCVYVDACPIPWGNQSAASELLWHNFNRYYEGNRAPLGFNMHAGWFYDPTRLKAMDQFIEALSQKDDVYILTISQVIEWLKNPTPLDGIKYFDPWGCSRSRKIIFPEESQLWKDVHHHPHHNSRVSQPWLQHRDTVQEQQQVAPKETDPKPQGTQSSRHSPSWWQNHSWLFERKSQPRQEVDQNTGNPPEAKAPPEPKRNVVYTVKKKPEVDSRSGTPMGGIGRMMGSKRSTSQSAAPTPKPRKEGPNPSQVGADSHSSILWTIGSKVPDTRGKVPSDSNAGQLMKVLFEADLQHPQLPQQRLTTAKPLVPKTNSRFPTPEQALTRSFPRSDIRSVSINERMPSGFSQDAPVSVVPENMKINSASTQEVPHQIEQNKQGINLGPSQEPQPTDSASIKESQREKLARLKQQLDGLHAKYIDASNAQSPQAAKATQVEPKRHIPSQGERRRDPSRPRPSKTGRDRQGRDSLINDQARLDKDYKILDFIEPKINQGNRPSRKKPSDTPEFIFEPIKSKKSTHERRIPDLSSRDIPVSDRPQDHKPDAQMLDSNTNIQATIARQTVDVDPWSNPRMSDQSRDINAGINETPKSTMSTGRSVEGLPFLPDHLMDHPRPDAARSQDPSQTTSSLDANKMTFRFGPTEPEINAPASSVPRPPQQTDLRVREPSQEHRTTSADKIRFRFGQMEPEINVPASGVPLPPHQPDLRVQEPSQEHRATSTDKIRFRFGPVEPEINAPASGVQLPPRQPDTRVQEPSQKRNGDKMTFRLGRMEPETNAPASGVPPPPSHHPDTFGQESSQRLQTSNDDNISFRFRSTEPEMNQPSSPDFPPQPPPQSRLPFLPDHLTDNPPPASSQQPAAPALPEIVFRFGNPNDHKNEPAPGNIPSRNLEEETRQREMMDAWFKQQQKAAQPEHGVPPVDTATTSADTADSEGERILDMLSKMKAPNPSTNHQQDLPPSNFAPQPPDTFDSNLHFGETNPPQSPPTQPLPAASSPVDRFMKTGSLSDINFGKSSSLGQHGTLNTDIAPEQSADFNDKLSAFLASQGASGAPVSPDSQPQEIISVEQPIAGSQSHNGPLSPGTFVDSPTFINTQGIDEMPPSHVLHANEGLLPSVPYNPPVTVPPQSTASYTTEPPYGVCQQDINCFLPDCLCKSVEIPGGIHASETPQIVYIVMDGNVNTYMEPKIKSIFDGTRRNPNGCRISGTMFLSHKYSNYTIVKSLSRMGVEIGLAGMQPINNENVSLLKQDIDNQLHNLVQYGVDTSEVSGWSSPGLNPKGDEQFRILNRKRFYDSTLLTVDSDQRLLWPFTLDFSWGEPCLIETCPKQPHYGMWEVPIIPLRLDKTNATCKYADSCTLQQMNVLETKDYLWDNFKRYYNGNKAPFGIRIHQFWFHTHFADSLQGLTEFLDEILQLNDVYITSVAKMLDWLQQPTPLSDLHVFPFWMC